MSDRADGPLRSPRKPLFDRSEDQVYFKAIESLFIELRGAPFQLSPDDFDVAKLWRAEGVPLDVALATLREKITTMVEKGGEPKRRLKYYRRAVESAWQRQRELAAPGETATATEVDVAARLARLAQRVPETLPEIRRRISRLADAGGSEAVDKSLAEMDRDMLAAARDALSSEQREELESRLEASMAALAGRLGGASTTARERAEIRLLRDLTDLPFLSLFSPDSLSD